MLQCFQGHNGSYQFHCGNHDGAFPREVFRNETDNFRYDLGNAVIVQLFSYTNVMATCPVHAGLV
jgi:hypothetical protein